MTKAKRRLPSLKAAIICDQAIKDQATGKWTLVGIWDRITPGAPPSPKEPILHPQSGLYFYLVDCNPGRYSWEIELVHYGNIIEPILKIQGDFEVGGGMRSVEFAVNLRGLPIVHFGKHTFKLSIEGTEIAEKEFMVLQRPGG